MVWPRRTPPDSSRRDPKPESVLVTPEGVPRNLDFGLKEVDVVYDSTVQRVSRADVTVGTARYMSPEAARTASARLPLRPLRPRRDHPGHGDRHVSLPARDELRDAQRRLSGAGGPSPAGWRWRRGTRPDLQRVVGEDHDRPRLLADASRDAWNGDEAGRRPLIA